MFYQRTLSLDDVSVGDTIYKADDCEVKLTEILRSELFYNLAKEIGVVDSFCEHLEKAVASQKGIVILITF